MSRGSRIALGILCILLGIWIALPLRLGPAPYTRSVRARSEISALTTALNGYRDDWGAYPPSDGPGALVRYLDGDVHGPNGGPRRILYYDFEPRRVRASLEYEDPWGRPFEYELLGTDTFRLVAPGLPE